MLLIYIDVILLIILVTLTIFTFCFCIYHMNRLHKKGRVTILVDPRHVFRDKDHDDVQKLHSTVVTYGCGAHPRAAASLPPASPPSPASPASPASPDSGLSDAYEPLDLPDGSFVDRRMQARCASAPPVSPSQYNRITKTWNWNYKEYQI